MAKSPETSVAVAPVVKLAVLGLRTFSHDRSYGGVHAPVANRIGLTKLGATYLEIPPGKAACPFHVHRVDDEMFVILEGSGRYRFGTTVYEVEAGDVLGAPCGGARFAHKLTNTGATTLKYLAISTKAGADICEYPDSGKFAVGTRCEDPADEFGFIGRTSDSCGYWEGEPDNAL